MYIQISEAWDDFKPNLYGLFTLPSAIREFYKIDRENSLQDNAIYLIFSGLKCLPLVGNITYLTQKLVRWIKSESAEKQRIFFEEKTSQFIKSVEDKMYLEETATTIETLSVKIDEELKKLDKTDQKELIRHMILNFHKELPGFVIEPLLDDLYKKDPSAFKDVIRNSEDAQHCASRAEWMTWASKNVPQLIGECLNYHQEPIKLVFESDPTHEKAVVWEYAKNNIDMLKKMARRNGDIPRFINSSWLSIKIIEDLFSSKDEMFNCVMPMINYKQRPLLCALVYGTSDKNWIKMIESIVKSQPERFQAYVKNNLDDFVKAYHGNGLERIIDFSRAAGEEVVKLVREKHSDELKELAGDFFRDYTTYPDMRLNLYIKLHKIDPELFRTASLKWARGEFKTQETANLALIALRPLAFSFYDEGIYEQAVKWLVRNEPRLFIQLIGMAKSLDETDEINQHLAKDFNLYIPSITLDSNNLPTADELAQFYTKLDENHSIVKPALHILQISPVKDKAMIQLLASTSEKLKDSLIKIVFEAPAFDLSKKLTETKTFRETFKTKEGSVDLHRTFLDQFEITPKELENCTKEQITAIHNFIYKGECTLNVAAEMGLLLKKCKPISYLEENDFKKLSKDQQEQFGKMTFKKGDIQESIFIHKVVLGLGELKTLTNLIFPKDLGMKSDDYIVDGEELGCDKTSLQCILSVFYTWHIKEDNLTITELTEIMTLGKLWNVEVCSRYFNRTYEARLNEQSEQIKELNFEERKALIGWINETNGAIRLYEKLPLLDGLSSEERRLLIDAIFDMTLLPGGDHFENFNNIDNICFFSKNLITNMTLQEQMNLLERMMKSDLAGSFEHILKVCKNPFSMIFKVGKNCEASDWYFKQDRFEPLSSLIISGEDINEKGDDLFNLELKKRRKIYEILKNMIEENQDLSKSVFGHKTRGFGDIMELSVGFRGMLTQLIIDLDSKEAQELIQAFGRWRTSNTSFKSLWYLNFSDYSFKATESYPDFEYLLSHTTVKRMKQVTSIDNGWMVGEMQRYSQNCPKFDSQTRNFPK